MSTYTQILYHIVFSTKDRQPVLNSEVREPLFRYVWGIIKNKNCHLYRIGGSDEHVHILTSLHPSLALADFIKDIKVSSTKWAKENKLLPDLTHWQDGYGAFTHSIRDKDRLIEYIKAQTEHHKKVSFLDELRELLVEARIDFDERYLA
jgi:REP element-mobilizing transposase RayT